MKYCITSNTPQGVRYVGNVGKGGYLHYGLVEKTDPRVLKFGNPSACHLALQSIRSQYRSQSFAMVEWKEGV